MPKHRLRREIIATVVVNDMVNKAGTSFDHRMLEESGASVPDITRAHIAARDVFAHATSCGRRWRRSTARSSPDVQLDLWLRLRQLVERGVLWLLRHRRPPLDLEADGRGLRARRRSC